MRSYLTKKISLIGAVLLGSVSLAGEKVVEYTLPEVKAELVSSTAWPDRTYIAVASEEYVHPYEPEGAPQIPYRVLQFAI